MDKKFETALAVLEKKHSEASADRKAAIEAATKDVRDLETMLRDARTKVAALQQEHMNASFAYDAERAKIEAEAKTAKAA